MNNKRMKFLALILSLTVTVSMFGQSLKDVYKYMSYGESAKAITAMEKLVSFEPSNQINQLYLANLYQSVGKTDLAMKTMTSLTASDPKSYTTKAVNGLLAFMNGGDKQAAIVDIDKAIKKSKNLKSALSLAIGQFFIYDKTNKDLGKAIFYLNNAFDNNNKDPFINMTLAEAYKMKGDNGKAITHYEYAAENDKTLAAPRYNIGSIYIQARNYTEGVPMLRQAIEADPNYPYSYRDLGKYYFDINKFDDAKETYSKFIKMNNPTLDERVQYGNILFLAKDYEGAYGLISEIKKEDSKRNYLNRLLGYSSYETGRYDDGLKYMEVFFEKHDTAKVLASDFEYLGKLQLKKGKDSLAILNLIKSSQMDTAMVEELSVIADTMYKQKKYFLASKLYRTKAENTSSAYDYYLTARAYYQSKDYQRVDSMAMKIIELKPESVTGYLYRARANTQLDTASVGLAAPFYTKFIELGSVDQEKNKREIIEASNYLSVLYYNQGNYDLSKMYVDKVLAIDPANAKGLEMQKAVLNPPKPDKK